MAINARFVARTCLDFPISRTIHLTRRSCPLVRPFTLPFSDMTTLSAIPVLQAFPEAYTERGRVIEEEERNSRLDTPIFVCQLSFPGLPTILHFFEPR